MMNPEGVAALSRTKLQIPNAVMSVLAGDPAGADLAVHLAEHPDVAEQLNKMPVDRAVRDTQEALVILRYEAGRVHGQQAQDAPAAPRRSMAPPVITPLRGGSTKSSLPLDELPYSEYRAERDRQSKARYRR
jgi:hypothetical protein